MSIQQQKELLSLTQSISGALECAKGNVFGMRQQLAEARARIQYLEEELALHKEKAAGIVTRDHLNKFYLSVRGRPAFDKEWEVFLSRFTFDSDDLCKSVVRWIEVMGPLIDLHVLPLDEDPQMPAAGSLTKEQALPEKVSPEEQTVLAPESKTGQ